MFAIFKKHDATSTIAGFYPALRKAGVAYATRAAAEAALAADPRETPVSHEVRPCTEGIEDIYEDVFFYEVL